MDDVTKEHVESERSFLHEISNQLVIAQGMANYVYNAQKKKDNIDEKELLKMEKALNAMDKMITLVKSRRNYLIAQSN